MKKKTDGSRTGRREKFTSVGTSQGMFDLLNQIAAIEHRHRSQLVLVLVEEALQARIDAGKLPGVVAVPEGLPYVPRGPRLGSKAKKTPNSNRGGRRPGSGRPRLEPAPSAEEPNRMPRQDVQAAPDERSKTTTTK